MKNSDLLIGAYIAHRGLHNKEKGIPENSLAAFKRAVDLNIPIELDLHLLKDGNVAVFHDDNLQRMTGCDRDIKDCTYDEIRDLRLYDTEERIPLLEEVLRLVDGRVLLDIELKNDLPPGQLEPEVCKLLDSYTGDFVVKAFSPFIVRWFKKFRPSYIRGQLSCNFKDNPDMNPITKFICRYMLLNFLTKPDFIAYDISSLPNGRVARYRHRKMPVLIWTIRSTEALKSAAKYGDGFIFEEPVSPPSQSCD